MNNSMLNETQQKVLSIEPGPVLIIAGAGTGKTTVIIHKIKQYLQDYPDSRAMAITFTNKAANNMLVKLQQLGIDPGRVWVGTFHRTALRIIKTYANEQNFLQYQYNIIDEGDQLKIIKQICIDHMLDVKLAKEILYNIGYFKETDKVPKNDNVNNHLFLKVFQDYQNKLEKNKAIDFTDIINCAHNLLEKNPQIREELHKLYSLIVVDEYQDTSCKQYAFLKLLINTEHNNICCIGDDAQSIYSWRGANIEYIMDFPKEFPQAKIIKFEENYRSHNAILKWANNLIAHNTKQYKKNLFSGQSVTNSQARQVHLLEFGNDLDESHFIAQEINRLKKVDSALKYSDCIILLRANFQAKSIENILTMYQIPYKIIGGIRFYQRQEIRDLLGYLSLIVNTDNNLAFERVINSPKRGIGSSMLDKIAKTAADYNLSLYAAAQRMQIAKLATFFAMMEKWKLEVTQSGSISVLLNKIIRDLNYFDHIEKDKQENVNRLVENSLNYNKIDDFLESVQLAEGAEEEGNGDDKVIIMTMHGAKGLEFKTVFLPAWEEGIFPSYRTKDENGMEEERRLAYVAITRAQEHLYISHCRTRKLFMNAPAERRTRSRFLKEILIGR